LDHQKEEADDVGNIRPQSTDQADEGEDRHAEEEPGYRIENNS
jgi:hypothetical protein